MSKSITENSLGVGELKQSHQARAGGKGTESLRPTRPVELPRNGSIPGGTPGSGAQLRAEDNKDKGRAGGTNDEKSGRSLRKLAQRQGVKQGSATFVCEIVVRHLRNKVGLSLHKTRWCEQKEGGNQDAYDAKYPSTTHDSGSVLAQHHENAIWDQAFIHIDSKCPSQTIFDIKMKPRLKLPNVNDSKKWKHLDDAIFTALAVAIPKLNGPVDMLFRQFTDTVYGTAEEICGVVVEKKREVKRQEESHRKRESKALHVQRLAKKEARRLWRRTKAEGGDVYSAYKTLMQAVRLHHDLAQSVKKSKEELKQHKAKERFLQDPNRYAKDLLSPPTQGKPNFTKEVADQYFPQTYSDKDRSFIYNPPAGLPRPPEPKSQVQCRVPFVQSILGSLLEEE